MPPSPERFRALDLGGTRLYWLDGGGFRVDGGTMFGRSSTLVISS
jgi:hypothetical protein